MVCLRIQNGNIIIIAMETTKFYVQSPKLDNTWHLQVIALSFIFYVHKTNHHTYILKIKAFRIQKHNSLRCRHKEKRLYNSLEIFCMFILASSAVQCTASSVERRVDKCFGSVRLPKQKKRKFHLINWTFVLL